MTEYEFTLTFALPDTQGDPAQHIDALFDASCDDAVVGTSTLGMIFLTFNREADSATDAVESAIHDVMTAIPGVCLNEAKPDMMGLTGVCYSHQ